MKTNFKENVSGLIRTALGQEKPDLRIKRANLVNVLSQEILENVDVLVKNGSIAAFGKKLEIFGRPQTINAAGKYLVPGFLDGHVHIESSTATLTQFSRAVLPCGTTGVFIDPHEIANVLGLAGVRLMLDEAKHTPLRVFATIPSCVPSSRELETS